MAGLLRAMSAGITSACAEQTMSSESLRMSPGDHLRVCGADSCHSLVRLLVQGSPPRVRSRPGRCADGSIHMRITSACAEQTLRSAPPAPPARDHLRVCGADPIVPVRCTFCQGSPPRVRSRHYDPDTITVEDRITSACAEQTCPCRRSCRRFWDHLRVCGADYWLRYGYYVQRGSPPRVRSRHDNGNVEQCDVGITSACAEQTIPAIATSSHNRDHLRVCGADPVVVVVLLPALGSPPRVRSRLLVSGGDVGQRGITSACAEQT